MKTLSLLVALFAFLAVGCADETEVDVPTDDVIVDEQLDDTMDDMDNTMDAMEDTMDVTEDSVDAALDGDLDDDGQ